MDGMRFPRAISSEEENFRLESRGPGIGVIKRDSIEPEPIGTIVLIPIRVVGFDRDCDGSLMPRLELLNTDDIVAGLEEPDPLYASPDGGKYSGIITRWGLYPSSGIVITEEALREMTGKI